MRRISVLMILAMLGFASGAVWAANDYSLVYSTIDVSGGPVASADTPVEDLVTLEFSAPAVATSTSYTIASILRWPEDRNAASNWTLYE